MSTFQFKFVFPVILFVHSAALGQCPTGNVTINSQADADNYALNYGNCDTLPGDLTISGFGINDLSAFAGLDVILGDVDINNLFPGPMDLSGFSELDEIGGELYLFANSRLQSLNGLNSLDRVGGDVFISSCDSIREANGLNQLDVVGGKLQFFSLTDFKPTGLNDLDTVYGDLILIQTDLSSTATAPNNLLYVGGEFYFGADNATQMNGGNALTRVKSFSLGSGGPALQNISGFNALETVDSVFNISYNASLTNLNGFNALDSIGHRFAILNNASLGTINGFGNLGYSWNFLVYGNDVLSSLNGFDHPITIPDHMQINNNPLLSVCNVQAVCDHLIANLSSSIYSNAIGCETTAIVYGQCLSTSVSEVVPQDLMLSVYPNPAQDAIRITTPAGPFTWIIFDGRGGAVAKGRANTGEPLPVAGLSAGPYTLRWNTTAASGAVRFTKE